MLQAKYFFLLKFEKVPFEQLKFNLRFLND
jgi:hypothetical protein